MKSAFHKSGIWACQGKRQIRKGGPTMEGEVGKTAWDGGDVGEI